MTMLAIEMHKTIKLSTHNRIDITQPNTRGEQNQILNAINPSTKKHIKAALSSIIPKTIPLHR